MWKRNRSAITYYDIMYALELASEHKFSVGNIFNTITQGMKSVPFAHIDIYIYTCI